MAKRYEKVSEDVRRRIESGEYSPGDRLPAETALAAEYKVSLPTMRQALAALQTEGLIEKRHGRGNFVRKQRQRAERSNLRHQWEKNRARADLKERSSTGATELDTGLSIKQLAFHAQYERIQAPEELATALGVEPGTAVLKRTYRTRSTNEDEPLNVARSYIPYELAEQNPDLLDESQEPWPGGTMNQLHTVGVEVDRVEEVITARPPTGEEVEELGLMAGVSVMDVRKTLYDISGRIVEVADVVLPGDRYAVKCVTTLERW
ncbi:GntR family transcriptional regulator [Streptomyces sp. MK5]|uniref:GntR family transcriptional regulator n=1 Tax=Streptomyces sp. MK5 TaxID=3064253 RepID=UPI00274103D4|nr:GntR family transcriptional regulator [Streptomyces sp. MK5]